MRIVGGKHRGRRLNGPAGMDIRPTSDRAREALFNILSHGDYAGPDGAMPENMSVIDVFAGTGALGLEAPLSLHVSWPDGRQQELSVAVDERVEPSWSQATAR